jgi:hypothetical protein
VNTHADYRRHSYRPPEGFVTEPASEEAVSQFAHHRDPSLTAGPTTPTGSKKGIAWVRPTDLATYAAPLVGRGIDLHAELIRRARRTPATTTRAIQHGLPHSPSPTSPVNRQEGLQL